MSDVNIKRTEKEYEVAKKIIQVLVNRKIIDRESGLDDYLETWDAALEVVGVVNSDKSKDLAENEALKAENEKLTRNVFEKDFEVAVLEANYEELAAFKEKLKYENSRLASLLPGG